MRNGGRVMTGSKAHGFGLIDGIMFVGFSVILAASFALPAAAQTPSFQGLGQMPGAAVGFGTFAIGLSNNGSTIVGYAWVCVNGGTTCNSTDKTYAFRWTAAGKYQVLGHLGG